MAKKAKAVPMPKHYDRYILVNESTGEVLDDAQGYGYRSPQKAHAAWNYKHPTSKQSHNRKLNKQFIKNHKDFVKDFEYLMFEDLKDGVNSYQDFKDLLSDRVPDFQGSARSLYFYLKNH